jgi:flagellar protein FliO/FliZ
MTLLSLTLLSKGSDLIDALNSSPTPSPEGGSKVVFDGRVSTTDSFVQLVSLVFVLIIILVAAYYTSRFVGKMKMGQMKKSNFQVIDTYRISQSKALQIVKIANKYVVIAIAKDTIEIITELEESEVMIRDFHNDEKQSFMQIIDKLKKKTSKRQDNHENTQFWVPKLTVCNPCSAAFYMYLLFHKDGEGLCADGQRYSDQYHRG